MNRRGFTLLELMLATTLVSVLMVGVMGVIGSLAPASLAAVADESEALGAGSYATVRLVQLIADDLSRMDRLDMKPDGAVNLYGQLALDGGTGRWLDRPAQVTYRFAEIGSRRLLLRRQRLLDKLTNQATTVELLAAGVKELQWVPIEAKDSPIIAGDTLPPIVVGNANVQPAAVTEVSRHMLRYAAAPAWRVSVSPVDKAVGPTVRTMVVR